MRSPRQKNKSRLSPKRIRLASARAGGQQLRAAGIRYDRAKRGRGATQMGSGPIISDLQNSEDIIDRGSFPIFEQDDKHGR